jgi:hypothetical protein
MTESILKEPALTYPESAISPNIIGRLAAATPGTLERPLPLVKQRSELTRKGPKLEDLPRFYRPIGQPRVGQPGDERVE